MGYQAKIDKPVGKLPNFGSSVVPFGKKFSTGGYVPKSITLAELNQMDLDDWDKRFIALYGNGDPSFRIVRFQ